MGLLHGDHCRANCLGVTAAGGLDMDNLEGIKVIASSEAASTSSSGELTCVDSSADLISAEQLDRWRFQRSSWKYVTCFLGTCMLLSTVMKHIFQLARFSTKEQL
jgi:hypothetical protein